MTTPPGFAHETADIAPGVVLPSGTKVWHYAQVREYLGEAYVIQGKLDLATSQLATIKTICGTGCEEYEDLAQAIQDSNL